MTDNQYDGFAFLVYADTWDCEVQPAMWSAHIDSVSACLTAQAIVGLRAPLIGFVYESYVLMVPLHKLVVREEDERITVAKYRSYSR